MKIHLFIFSIFILVVSGCAPHLSNQCTLNPYERLAHQIDLQINEPALETALVGIMVQSVKTGEILYQQHANTMMMPASNEKIPTAAAALMKFGPDFQFKTKLYATGSIADSVLHGDLVIVGSGDPAIGYRFCEKKDTCLIFRQWVNALTVRGIKKIQGNLIGIDDVFDDEFYGYGWAAMNFSSAYSAQINGINFNENYAQITIEADSISQEIHYTIFPDCGYVHLISDIRVIADQKQESPISIERIEGTNDIKITGKMKPGDRYKESVSVHNPTMYFLSGLRNEFAKFGIEISGKNIDHDDLPDTQSLADAQLIYTHHSPPLSEILHVLLKKSQNLYAECLVKALGNHFGTTGSFEEGMKIIKNTLERFGLEKESYQFLDGSGLSRYNYISPHHLVKILRGMYYHDHGEIFRNYLPIAGIDGTIDYRLKRTVAQKNISAKTGTISNVRSLSGYAQTQDDEVLAFSILVNNFLCDVDIVMDVQDRICMLLTSFSRK